jgi:hypothetical protein
MDLLVSYQWGRFGPAKREIRETLALRGRHAQVEPQA